MRRHSSWWTIRAKDRGRTDPGMFEEGESSGVCSAGCWGLVRPPREAQMPGWGTWTFLFVQRAQYLPKFLTPEHKVSDGTGPVQSLTIQSHS